jgi:protein O-mannosyl-transferase
MAKIRNTKYSKKGRTQLYIWLIIIVSSVIIAYYPSLKNHFVNWDDYEYVVENPHIQKLDIKSLKYHFSHYHMGNYHPLTMISLSFDRITGKGEASHFHAGNMLLHILNTVLLFFLLNILFRNTSMAGISALLFGVATIHVESVVWISERKDVLYTFFYFASLMAYIRYLDQKETRYFIFALVFFIFSLLSKGMAVSLSLVLLLIDMLKGRKLLSRAVLLEKIPFFLLSLIFGIIAYYAQQSGEQSGTVYDFSPLHRMIFASYGFMQYIFKLLYPYALSAFYPYPQLVEGSLDPIFYIYPFLVLIVFFLGLYALRKKNRIVLFSLLFYLFNVIFILQLLPVGDALMADRYAYLASVGFFVLIAQACIKLLAIFPTWKNAFYTGIAVYVLFMVIQTQNRSAVWKDSLALWNDVIQKHSHVHIAWNNRGIAKKTLGDIHGAVEDYSRAIQLKEDYAEAYNNRGNSLAELKHYDAAIIDYNKAIALENKYVKAYSNRARTYMDMKNFDAALRDYNKALGIQAENPELHRNKGLLFNKMQDYEKAEQAFSKAIQLKPDFVLAYSNRAFARHHLEQYEAAISDYDKAILLDDNYASGYYNRGISKYFLGDYNGACKDWNIASSKDYAPAKTMLDKYCR